MAAFDQENWLNDGGIKDTEAKYSFTPRVNFQILDIPWPSVFPPLILEASFAPYIFFLCAFILFLLRRNWSRGSDSDRWLSALTLYPIQRRFHPIKNHLCTLKLNGSQAAERKGAAACF